MTVVRSGIYNDIVIFSKRTRVFQSRPDVLGSKGGKSLYDFRGGRSCGKELQYLPHHNSCSPEYRLTMADFRIRNDIRIDLNASHVLYYTATRTPLSIFRFGDPYMARGAICYDEVDTHQTTGAEKEERH